MRVSTVFVALCAGLLPWFLVSCGTVVRATNAAGGKLRSLGGKRGGETLVESLTKPDADNAATQMLGGTIRLVRAPLGFVLIQSTSSPPPPRSELAVHRRGSAEPVAQLRMSPESKTGFLVADILSGEPREGDVVLWSLPDAPPPADVGLPDVPDLPLESMALPDLQPAATQIDTGDGMLRPVPTIDVGPSRPAAETGPVPLDPEAEIEREIRSGAGVDPE